MTELTEHLTEHETVVLELRPHWWFFAHDLAWGGLLGLAAGVLIATGLLPAAARVLVVGGVLMAWMVRAGIAYLAWSHTEFLITTRKVAYRSGVLGRHGVEIPLAQLTNIVFRQSMLERVLGAGTLELESAGQDGESCFTHVPNPERVSRRLHELLHTLDAADPGSPPASSRTFLDPVGAPPVTEALAQRLRTLAALRDEGHLDPAEFAAVKRRLLFGEGSAPAAPTPPPAPPPPLPGPTPR